MLIMYMETTYAIFIAKYAYIYNLKKYFFIAF